MGTTFLCSGLEKVNGIQKEWKNNTVKGSYQEQCFEEEKRNQDYQKEVDRRQKFTQRSGEQADALCGQGAGQQVREADEKSRTRTHQCIGQRTSLRAWNAPSAIGSLYIEQPRAHGG